jgi:hypothetical protein
LRRPSINSTPKSPPSSLRPFNSRKPSRPATVPSQSDLSDTPQGPEQPSEASLPSSPLSNEVLAPPSRLLNRASQTDLNSGQPEDNSWSRRKSKLKARSMSTDSVPHTAQSPADSSALTPKAAEPQTEPDDQIRKKKGILRGILRR